MNYDLRDTAGWKLMEHEERLNEILKHSKKDKNNQKKTGSNYDLRDTAGWKLMEQEERLKKFLKSGKKDN